MLVSRWVHRPSNQKTSFCPLSARFPVSPDVSSKAENRSSMMRISYVLHCFVIFCVLLCVWLCPQLTLQFPFPFHCTSSEARCARSHGLGRWGCQCLRDLLVQTLWTKDEVFDFAYCIDNSLLYLVLHDSTRPSRYFTETDQGAQIRGWIQSPWIAAVALHYRSLYHTLLLGGLEHGFYDFPYAHIYIYIHILGTMIPADEHIFQRGWNHQPD
jgi:hypothetical protein